MTGLSLLWLPILVSAIFVFVASSIIHMLSPWHKSDYRQVPGEDNLMATLRPLGIPPGDYLVPRPASRADMRSPAFAEKMKKGPVLVMTVWPSGPASMGRNLGLWFVYCALVGFFAAISRAVRFPPVPTTSRSSASSGRRRSSDIRSPSGRCRSGTTAPGVRP